MSTRAIFTGHNSDGISHYTSDSILQAVQPFGPDSSAFTTIHSSTTVPVSNTAALPVATNALPRCAPTGVLFCTTDFPPNYSAPMHRTQSVDYAIVMSGEICCRLDGGEEKTIKAGEVIVQRGTNHEWINRGEVPCRIVFVMVGSEKIVLDNGSVLEETVFKRP
ncbi:hypothetical protein BP5796_01742 [Coleophoma crateriformis]|uniref:Cupin type-2 domain-containing protein n=1 Tax=Coleophoma crateriformis TaxID=565419 RepID=A0A3D8T2X0_9HELO|nr:hypothetical protein BP5796_01742 [Coleophoma crateriformis]